MATIKRAMIIALATVSAAFLMITVGEYELSMLLNKIGAAIGLAALAIYAAKLLTKEW